MGSCLTILNIKTGTTIYCEKNNLFILQLSDNTDSYIKGWKGQAAKKQGGCFAFTFMSFKNCICTSLNRSHNKVFEILGPQKEMPFIRQCSTISLNSFCFKNITFDWFVSDEPFNVAGRVFSFLLSSPIVQQKLQPVQSDCCGQWTMAQFY